MLRSGLAFLEGPWIQCSSLSRETALGSGQSWAWVAQKAAGMITEHTPRPQGLLHVFPATALWGLVWLVWD